jgi:hypothetical protein
VSEVRKPTEAIWPQRKEAIMATLFRTSAEALQLGDVVIWPDGSLLTVAAWLRDGNDVVIYSQEYGRERFRFYAAEAVTLLERG